MCQMLNIWHISHTKHKKQLPINIAYVVKLYHLCPYRCKFAMVRTDVVNQKLLFYYFSLSSHFFIWFSLSLLRIYLSLSLSQVPNPFFFFSQLDARKEEGGAKEGGGQSSSSSTSANHNHHHNNKTQIQKNPTNPPRHHHILTHNHRNPPLHWNPQPPPTANQTQPIDPLLETTTTNQNHKPS